MKNGAEFKPKKRSQYLWDMNRWSFTCLFAESLLKNIPRCLKELRGSGLSNSGSFSTAFFIIIGNSWNTNFFIKRKSILLKKQREQPNVTINIYDRIQSYLE